MPDRLYLDHAATTPLLASISSPRNVVVTSTDNATTAAVAQVEIDRLLGMGVEKILFVSHLQDVNNDRALIPLLRGVDIAVAGGGDELLASSPDVENVSGEYFVKCRIAKPSKRARDDASALRLWELSEKLCNVSWR